MKVSTQSSQASKDFVELVTVFENYWWDLVKSSCTFSVQACGSISVIFTITIQIQWIFNFAFIQITALCQYNAVNFHPKSCKRHSIARQQGWVMVCLLWIQYLIYILPPSLQWCIQYLIILGHSITTLNYMIKWSIKISVHNMNVLLL